MTEPRRLGDLLAEVQRALDRGHRPPANPTRSWRYRLPGWWLRRCIHLWLALAHTGERRLRAAYDRLAEHDSRN